jgi:hypothetical protein
MKAYSYMKNLDILFRNDEHLLRLLYYKSNTLEDNIDIVTSVRPRITPPFLPDTHTIDPSVPFVGGTDSNNLRHSLILSSRKTSDLTNYQKCRLIFSLGDRIPDNQNYLASQQDMIIEIQAHTAFESIDYRMEKISDYVNSLLFNERTVGLGKVKFVRGQTISLSNDEYVGYIMIYKFGSVN